MDKMMTAKTTRDKIWLPVFSDGHLKDGKEAGLESVGTNK